MKASQQTRFTLDSWLPEYFRNTEDQWKAVQARVLTLLLLLYGVGFIPVSIAAVLCNVYGILDTRAPAIISAAGSLAGIAALLNFRRTANLQQASRLYAWMALAMVLAVIVYTGGWQSPVCMFFLTLPIIAGFAMDQKSRLFYAAVVCLLYTALFLLHRSGHDFFQLIPQPYWQTAQALVWTLALLSIASCLALFDLSENRLSAMLARDRADLERRANEDDLTGALNDQALIAYMMQQATDTHSGIPQRVIYVIVNNHRDIAQFFGNETADAFLAETAARLRQLLSDGAALGRYAVNEFVIYVPGNMNHNSFVQLQRKIAALQAKAIAPADGSRFLLDLGIGVFSCADADLSPQELTDRARATIEEPLTNVD